ncbi:hypothetical protein [Acinetobacter sp. SFB]|nr:hypothetical protein [Acinetobacter sp. SFB]
MSLLKSVLLGQFMNVQMQELKYARHFMPSDGFDEFKQVWDVLKTLLDP